MKKFIRNGIVIGIVCIFAALIFILIPNPEPESRQEASVTKKNSNTVASKVQAHTSKSNVKQTSIDFNFFDKEEIESGSYVPNQILVRFDETVSPAHAEHLAGRLGGKITKKFGKLKNLVLIQLPKSVGYENAKTFFSSQKNVKSTEPNFIYTTQVIPNDARFDELWGMNNLGQTGGTPDIDVNAPEAWEKVTG